MIFWTGLICAGPIHAFEPPPPATSLQIIEIPNDDLIARIRRLLPDATVTRTLPLDVFADLVQRARQLASMAAGKRPTIVRFAGRVDAQTGLLEGTAVCEAPLGIGSRWQLPRWNAAVVEISDSRNKDAKIDWGTDESGVLWAAGLSPQSQELRIRWQLSPTIHGSDWVYRLEAGDVAIAQLDLDLPPERVLADSAFVQTMEKGTARLDAKDGAIGFRLVPSEGPREDSIVYGVEMDCDVHASGIDYRAKVVIEVPRRPIDGLTVDLGPTAEGIAPHSGVAGVWSREELDAGAQRWRLTTPLEVGRHELILTGRASSPIGRDWSAPAVVLANASFRGENIHVTIDRDLQIRSVDPGMLVLETSEKQEDGRYRMRFRGSQSMGRGGLAESEVNPNAKEIRRGSVRPTITIDRVRPRVRATCHMELDLSKPPFEAVAAFDIHNPIGTVSQIQFQLPRDWRFASVHCPTTERVAEVRSQPEEDGTSRVYLTLQPALAEGESLHIEVSAFCTNDTESVVGSLRLVTPVIRMMDPPVDGGGDYEIRFAPSDTYSLDELPLPQLGRPVDDKSAGRPSYVFPLSHITEKSTVVISSPQPHYRASVNENFQWTGDHWACEVELDLDVDVKGRDSFHLATTQPLKEAIRWEVLGVSDAVVRLVPYPATNVGVPSEEEPMDPAAPPPPEHERYDYLLETSVPMSGRLKVKGAWTIPKVEARLPLALLPDAEEFLAGVSIHSPRGGVIQVQSAGVRTQETGIGNSEQVVWHGAYSQLDVDADLRVQPARATQATTPRAAGRAVVHSRSTISAVESIHDLRLYLDASHPTPLQVNLSDAAYVWRVELDAESVDPRIVDGVIDVSPSLPAGRHQCRIVYSAPTRRRPGLIDAEFTSPLPDWTVSCFLWSIEHDGIVYAWPNGALKPRASLRMLDVPRAESTIVRLADGKDVQAALSVAEATLFKSAQHDGWRLEPYAEQLGRALSPNWQIVVDRDIRILTGREPRLPTSLANWLALHGIVLYVEPGMMLFTSRVSHSLSASPKADWDAGRWLRDLSMEVSAQGVDSSGRFASAGLADGVHDEGNRAVVSMADRTHNRSEFMLLDFAAAGPAEMSADANWRVLLIPADLLTRLSRTLTVLGVASVLFFARHWTRRAHRRLLAGLLLTALGAAVVGGIAQQTFSLPLWASIGAAVLLLLRRSWTNRTIPAVLLFVGAFGVAPSTHADEPASLRRVLIPTDANAPVGQVILSEELARKLEETASRSVGHMFLRQIHLVGRPVKDRTEWIATIHATVEGATASTRWRLAFEGIEPKKLQVNGRDATWFPRGGQDGIEFSLPAELGEEATASGRLEGAGGRDAQTDWVDLPRRDIHVELEFEVPCEATAMAHCAEFGIPRAARTMARFSSGSTDDVLESSSRRVGWRIENDSAERIFALDDGPRDRIELRLTRKLPDANLEQRGSASISWLQLIEIASDRIDWTAYVQSDSPSSNSRRQLTLPSSVVVTSVDGKYANWSIGPSETAGRRCIEIDCSNDQPVELRGFIVRSSDRIDVGPLAIVDAPTRRGLIGVRLPEGGQLQIVESRNLEESSVEAFAALWGRLGQGTTPEAVALVRRVDPSTSEQAFSIQWRSATPTLTVRQLNRVMLDPHAGDVHCNTTATLLLSDVATSILRAKIPPGLGISNVTGAQLHQWFVQGDELVLLSETTWPKQCVVDLVLAPASQIVEPGVRKRVDFSVASLDWVGAKTRVNQWSVVVPAGWEVSDGSGVPSSGRSGTSEFQFETKEERIALAVTPIPQDLEVEAYTFVTVRGRETTTEGRFDIRSDRGPLSTIEVASPIGFKESGWRSDDWTLRSSRVDGEQRIWTFTSRALSPTATLSWRSTVLSGTPRIIPPMLKIEGVSRVHNWVAVATPSGQTMRLETSGLSDAKLPSPFADWRPTEEDVSNQWQVRAFEAKEDWQLVVSVNQNNAATRDFAVLSAQADLYEAVDGKLYCESQWSVLDLADGEYEVVLPENAQLQEVCVDGLSLPDVQVEGSTIHIPIFQKGQIQDLVVFWRCEIANSGEVFSLARLATTSKDALLVQVRHSGDSQWSAEARLSRAQWLIAQLERNLELLRVISAKGRTFDERRFRDLCRQSQAVEDQIVLAGPSATQEERTIVQTLAAERQTLMTQAPTIVDNSGGESREELLTPGLLNYTSAESVSWLRTSSSAPELVMERHRFAATRTRTTNEWLRIAVAALALGIVLTRPVWDAMRLYWPAPMVMVGIAWWLFADTSWIGLGLIGLALAGGARSVHRWFEGRFTDIASTIMHRSTRLRLALEYGPAGSSVRSRPALRAKEASGPRRASGSSVRPRFPMKDNPSGTTSPAKSDTVP